MSTVLDVIKASLREIGVLAAGETPSAEDSADALAALNNWIDQAAAERLQIYTITRTTFTITSGTGTYSVAGAVNVPRPVFIDHVNFIDTSTNPDTEYPLQPLTDDAYAGIVQKAQTGVFPASWYYNPTFPTGTISLFPVPTSTTLQGVLYAPQAVASFAALTTAVSLPPGYSRMITKNLALELLPSYSRQPDPALVQQAMESKATVKRANTRLTDLSFGADALIGGGGSSYDIYTG